MSGIENDLSDYTEPPSRYGAALTTIGMTAVGMIPGVGGAIASAAQGTLAQRQAERDADFATRVAARLRKVEDRPSPEEMLASDEFIAAWERASRMAAESANEAKRERLARVLAQTGPWGPWDPEDREILLGLVGRYNEEHVALLNFLRDPVAAIRRRQPSYDPASVLMTGVNSLVTEWLYPDNAPALARLDRIAGDLTRDGTTNVNMSAVSMSNGAHGKHTTELGDRFLDLVADY